MKNVPVCTFKTFPFVPAPRAHVFQHVCAWCRYTRGRFERTHGDVLSGHTEFRSVSHTNTHTLTHTTQPITTQHITTTTPHGERQRQRKKTGTEREEKTEEERQDKRREDKRRQKREVRRFFFQCGGAWPFFFVGVVICLVNPVCARDLSLPNSVKYDSF